MTYPQRWVRGAGGEHPPAGWWDEEINDGAEALEAAPQQQPVRQGQGLTLSDTRAAAKEKNTKKNEDLETKT